MERNLADFFDGGDILKPQISQITLIFRQLQIKGIVIFRTADYADYADFTQIEFLDAPLRQAQGAQGTAHELTWIGWREMDFGHKSFKNLS